MTPPGFSEAQLFRLAVDLCPSGMMAADAAGAIILVNREVERLFGYDREELIGRPIEMLVPERYRPAHPGHRAHFFHDPRTRPMGAGRELFGLRRDGSEFPIEIGLNPIQTADGVCVLSSIVDVSARRSMEEQLRQSQKMEAVGTLAGGIAHDFNNLLLSIVGHAELAMSAGPGDERQKADLEQVLKAAERGRQLVQRILMFSRQREVSRRPLRLMGPVREALQLLRASLPTTLEIREILDAETPEVLADDTQVHQIVMNLATNSAHAMPTGGTLEVRLGPFPVDAEFAATHPPLRPGPHARLSVSDTGQGMPAEVLARAFEPFFTTKPTGQGTGLGLAVIHGIVRAQGGAIALQSRPGQGTWVDVFLPAHQGDAAAEGAVAAGDEAPAAAHLLVVEDEEILASLLKRQIESLGYRATVHTSSTDALEDFLSRPQEFDLLVTDNTMPRMTGLALTRRILSVRNDLPVLLVSGLADTADPGELRKEGIRGLLPKPHTGSELAAAIRELLAGRGAPRA